MEPTLEAGHFGGVIVLADISGYTSFLDNVRIAHQEDEFADGQVPDAYALMSNLLNGIASIMNPPLTLVKFEGDAVFSVAVDEDVPRHGVMLECVERCYRDFTLRLAEAGSVWSCTCAACRRKDLLDLKFVVHHGDYFVQAVGRHVDVLGPDVNIAHRLLKSSASDYVGPGAYALFSNAAVDALDLPLSDATPFTEHIEGMQPIDVRVVALS